MLGGRSRHFAAIELREPQGHLGRPQKHLGSPQRIKQIPVEWYHGTWAPTERRPKKSYHLAIINVLVGIGNGPLE